MSGDNLDLAVARLGAKLEDKFKAAELEKHLVREQRQAAWLRIQQESPQVSDFLIAVNQVFGKPEKIKIEINGEIIVSK